MTTFTRVTVLIPCHSLKYLEQSLSSIRNQTLSRDSFEVLIIADRIDIDHTTRILDETQLRFRIIQSLKPGIVPALNLGLKNITSEFVARMDDDDLMMPTRLESQLRHLEDNPDVLAVGGQLQLIDHENKPIGFARYRKKVRLKQKDLLMNSPLAHPATMFRLQSVLSVGGYRSFLAEDWDLWIRLRELGCIENLEKLVLRYRIHPEQLSREKMYMQSISRQFITTSFFARQSKLRDHPNDAETPADWLQKTQDQLQNISKDYRKFQRHNQKIQEINAITEMNRAAADRIVIALLVGSKYPILFVKFSISKTLSIMRKRFE